MNHLHELRRGSQFQFQYISVNRTVYIIYLVPHRAHENTLQQQRNLVRTAITLKTYKYIIHEWRDSVPVS